MSIIASLEHSRERAGSRGGEPVVSIVIAVRDGELTLRETLASLQGQTFGEWEAVVIDDGSKDGTALVAEAAAASDPRIRLVRRSWAGLSTTRNVGVELARGEWLLFLDADDLLLPETLEELVSAAAEDPRAGVVYCGFARVDAAGSIRISETRAELSGDLFDQFARRCVFACHCALVRRKVVVDVGGFDVEQHPCEDWDLWQRIARTGASFRAVDRVLALYRTQITSMSMDAAGLASGALRVIERGHAPDPRVTSPAPQHAEGASRDRLPLSRLGFWLWAAGLALGKGEAWRLPQEIAEDVGDLLTPSMVADQLYDAVPVGACVPVREWPELWARHKDGIDTLLLDLERSSHAPLFVPRTLRLLERRVIAAGSGGSWRVGRVAGITIELTKPLVDVEVEADVDVLYCRLKVDEQPLGSIELPSCDGIVPAYVLADAIAARFAWDILGLFFQATDPEYELARHDDLGWTRFLRELWNRPSWPLEAFYDRGDTTEAEGTGLEAFMVLEVSEDIPGVDVRAGTLVVQIEVGGSPLGLITLPGGRVVTADELCATSTELTGFELCRAAVREGVIGRELTPGLSLRELLRNAARSKPNPVSAALAPRRTGVVLARRLPDAFGSSTSRRAALPAASLVDLQRVAEVAGDRIVGVGRADKQPECMVYAPEVISIHVACPSSLSAAGDGYEVATNDQATADLPILLYHRIADGVEGALARYAVTRGAFESQLAHLRQFGYHSISLDDWRRAAISKRPLPGRAVMITFDDGYLDFLTDASPLLRKFGFAAVVFLVAERIGETNRWDTFASQAPLLSWNDIRRLQTERVTFGSHTMTHPAATGLSNAEITSEFARSRAILQAGLGCPVSAFAYPYGDWDPSVAHLAGACGYTLGFTTDSKRATFDDSLLALPRIEIAADDGIADFAAKLAVG